MKEVDDIERIKMQNVGKWVAIKDKKVIATSESYRELFKTLKAKQIKSGVTVVYSAKPEEKKYGFLYVVLAIGNKR